MVTPQNLKRMGTEVWFISRLPASYAEHQRVISEAVAGDQWRELGRLAASAPSGQRVPAEYKLSETTVMLDEQSYRAVVVLFEQP